VGLKVHIQNIWPSPDQDKMIGPSTADIYDAQLRMFRDILGPEAVLQVRYNARSSYFTSCFSMDAYNTVGMLDGLAEAGPTGCDVAIVACGNDPAIDQARDMLTIPVVGLTQSGMLVAMQLGKRFGVITMDDASVAVVERNLRAYAMEDRAVRNKPVRSPGFYEAGANWFTDPQYLRNHVIPRFENVARGLIEDGADVIVTACGNYAAFSIHGYAQVTGTAVPIVESTAAGIEMARLLGDLYRRYGLKTSKHGAYAGLDPGVGAWAVAAARGPAPDSGTGEIVHR